MGTILIGLLAPLLLGALPTWPYSGSWGYYPSGGLGLVFCSSSSSWRLLVESDGASYFSLSLE